MRKSAAPSQITRTTNGRQSSVFTPPYKPSEDTGISKSKRICRGFESGPITKENEDSKTASASGSVKMTEAMGTNANFHIFDTSLANKCVEKENLFAKQKSSAESISTKAENSAHSSSCDTVESIGGLSNVKKTRPFSEHKLQNSNQESEEANTRYYSAVWCKLSKKKHKKWEGDAIVIVKCRSVILKDLEGKEIGQSSGYKLKDLESLEEGNTLAVGSKEIEIQGMIEASTYYSGKCFQVSVAPCSDAEGTSIAVRPKPKPFRLPFKDSLAWRATGNKSGKPLYDPSDVDAIVLPRPPTHHQHTFNTTSLPVVDVVVDPRLTGRLRPHQQAGVVFLYECVMGYRVKSKNGAILADEMGLGKTLQCITLVWTLLKQGPYGGTPLVKNVLIVTPSSLVLNWEKEFDKWLGKERLQLYVVDQHNKTGDFCKQKISPVLVISYEMVVRCIDKIEAMNFDLMLCDEGHRLKNSQIKTTALISNLNIKRRVIVTGTPIQNDLQELYSLVEFVNPGTFGSSSMFRKVYEEHIIRAQQPLASREEKEIGESRAAELNRLASNFTLRRTQEIINKYLPPKTEYVVFCKPAKTQIELYKSVVGSRGLLKCLTNSFVGDHLGAICILRKLCNHPGLLSVNDDKEQVSELQSEITRLIPQELCKNSYLEEDSGKLAVVSCLLWALCEAQRERIVIVSNFTTTLDMLQQLCGRYKYPFLRLDGTTPTSKRQAIVDRFNSTYCEEFVFLLSARAGGVGLNLIGASRILLYDIDWNPATDLQAMARVWRDGQSKNVFIYRLILAGSIEEKMYQRQVCKQGISGSVVDARNNTRVQFSAEELKDLFQFHPDVSCLTHDQLHCPCDQMGEMPTHEQHSDEKDVKLCGKAPQRNSTTMDQLFNWQHFAFPKAAEIIDDMYLEYASEFITFIFKSKLSQENMLSQ